MPPQRARQLARQGKLYGHWFPLLEGFSGELFLTPEIIPVCVDFRRMICDLHIKPKQLFTLNSRQFEELVAEIWRNLGYEIELTARTRDQGRDNRGEES